MTLGQARRRFCFFIHMQGRTGLRRKAKAHAWLYCAALSYQKRGKELGTPYFTPFSPVLHDVTTLNESARRPPWHPKFKRTCGGNAHGYAACSLAEFSLERVFSSKKLTASCFPPASKRGNCMSTVSGSLVVVHFLTRGKNMSSKNEGECFGINRANKWVRVRQSFPEPPRRRSAARLSPRLCPTAKLCPCYAEPTTEGRWRPAATRWQQLF